MFIPPSVEADGNINVDQTDNHTVLILCLVPQLTQSLVYACFLRIQISFIQGWPNTTGQSWKSLSRNEIKWWCFRPLLCTLLRLNWAKKSQQISSVSCHLEIQNKQQYESTVCPGNRSAPPCFYGPPPYHDRWRLEDPLDTRPATNAP